MSRGLGLQQRRMLQAIARVRPPDQGRDWLSVSLAVNEFCRLDNQLSERVDRLREEKRQREETERAEWKRQDQEYRDRVAAGVAAGDPEAIDADKRLTLRDFLGRAICSWRPSKQSIYAGRCQERDIPEADALFNPSRIINALVKRGLVQKSDRGSIRLTEDGAALVAGERMLIRAA